MNNAQSWQDHLIQSHEKRIRALERIVWAEMGAIAFLQFIPVIHTLIKTLGG